ncbi:hypothetical protein I553_2268 [Mycobacterium xenopi 4042]|uniref:Uncharacterized protein n=1 Tax=Mycobacterium xenopi 4042 TaxID=1299334 RepID=X8DEW6_MYCXE|nr:hypothetical protein I553_2268 [Mycobacterium xenopi 4042]
MRRSATAPYPFWSGRQRCISRGEKLSDVVVADGDSFGTPVVPEV